MLESDLARGRRGDRLGLERHTEEPGSNLVRDTRLEVRRAESTDTEDLDAEVELVVGLILGALSRKIGLADVDVEMARLSDGEVELARIAGG